MNNLPPPPMKRKRGIHTAHGAGRARARDAGFLAAPGGRQVPKTDGITAAAQANAKPPAMLILHDPWMLDAHEPPVPVFGQYPRGLVARIASLLRAERREILHVCSGSLPLGEGIRVDLRQAARPDVRADGRALPFRSGAFRAVLLDPPYTAEYADGLYGTDYPLPSHLLAEAARVVQPGGRIGFVHFTVPYPPPGCSFVRVVAISTGCGYQLRAVTIFEREQALLPGVR